MKFQRFGSCWCGFPLHSRRCGSWALAGWLLVVILAKLVLTSREEILAFYLPHDSLWHIRAAERLYWEGAYEPDRLYRLPVYSLFIALNKAIGVPLRLGTEIVFCAAGAWLAVALRRLGVPVLLAGIAGALALFHPASYQLLNYCSPDILLAGLMMGALAASFIWYAGRGGPRSWIPATLAALLWALAWNTRSESIVILPVLALFGLIVWVRDWRAGLGRRIAPLVVGAVVPVAACLAFASGIRTINYLRWGLYADDILTSPGYVSAYAALQRIRPEFPLDYIPVPVEVRHRAYAASPAFAKLKPFLEGRIGRNWSRTSRQFTDSRGLTELDPLEMSGGWFCWALLDAANAAKPGASLVETDRFFLQIGREINQAIRAGRLSGRRVPVAMIDPNISRWLKRVPASFAAIHWTYLNPADDFFVPNLEQEAAWGDVYDRVANRRAGLTPGSAGLIVGWVVAESNRVSALELRSVGGQLLGSAVPSIARPDVDPDGLSGFRLDTAAASESDWRNAELFIRLADGSEHRLPAGDLQAGRVVQSERSAGFVHLGCDRIVSPEEVRHWTGAAQQRIEGPYFKLIRILEWLAIPGLIAALLLIARKRGGVVALPILVLAVAVLVRMALMTVVDATAWPASQLRYHFPVLPLHVILLVLCPWALVEFGVQAVRTRKGIPSHVPGAFPGLAGPPVHADPACKA